MGARLGASKRWIACIRPQKNLKLGSAIPYGKRTRRAQLVSRRWRSKRPSKRDVGLARRAARCGMHTLWQRL